MGGLFSAIKRGFRAASNSQGPQAFQVAEKQVICNHCNNSLFYQSNALMNTAGLTFMNLDWANKSANVLTCSNCGNALWFKNTVYSIDA